MMSAQDCHNVTQDMTDNAQRTRADFIALSEWLTGVVGLDPGLASEYLDRFRAHPTYGGMLQPLIARYNNTVTPVLQRAGGDDQVTWEQVMAQVEGMIGEQLMDDPDLGPVAQQLIYLWYVGAFFEVDPTDRRRGFWSYGTNPEHYGRGLMWAVIRAHAPMTPGSSSDHQPSDGAAGEGPYWTRRPDVTSPVVVPPRWFAP
jgi:hypothetical protein